jgi:transcriptional regulator with XRE-family HTH domain
MPFTFSPIGELLMSAKRVAKESADWSRELGLILLDGIEDNEQGKQLAYDRVKGLHPQPQGKDRYPKDFDKWLTKVFGKSPENGVAPWLSLEFWQQQVDKVLIQGIFARNVTQDEVAQRIRSVWPKLSISWLSARMEEVARSGLPRWMDQKFWATAIDPILLSGIRNAGQCQCEAVETVLQAWPRLHVGMIWDRLRRLRKQRPKSLQAVVPLFALANSCNGGLATVDGEADWSAEAAAPPLTSPSTTDQRFCRREIDPILLRGIWNANQLERETVDKVLCRFSELRIGTIWARLRRLQEQQSENGHTGPPFRWTDELDERLIRIHEEAGLSEAVSSVQSLTGWPRRAILRRAHKLGLPSRLSGSRRRWTMVEYRFAVESLNHMSVREIAEEIGRSEKAVWNMVGQRGIPARFQDGYTMRELAEKLHVRRLSVQNWVEAGLLHRKRNGRIDEGSLQSFLYSHPETLKWPRFDQDTAFWVSELVEAERARINSAEAQPRAMSQNSEKIRAAEASTPAGTVSNKPGPGPSGDHESRSSQARAASPQLWKPESIFRQSTQESKPKKRRLSRMLSRVTSRVLHKTRAAIL